MNTSRTRAEHQSIWVNTRSQRRASTPPLPFRASSHPTNRCPGQVSFPRSVYVTFSTFLCFLLAISPFKMAPGRVLPGVPKGKEAVMASLWNCVLDWLCSGLRPSAFSRDSAFGTQHCIFSKVSLNRNTHEARLCIGRLTAMWSEALRNPTLEFL